MAWHVRALARRVFGDEGVALVPAARAVAVGQLAAVLILLAVDVAARRPSLLAQIAVKIAQALVLLISLRAAHPGADPGLVRVVAVGSTSVLYALAAVSGGLRGDVDTTLLLVAGSAMVTATLLPWGRRAQLATVIVAAAAFAAAASVWPLTLPLFASTVFFLLVVASVLVAADHDRRRASRHRLVKLLAAQTEVLEAVALGSALRDVLTRICEMVEAESPGVVCSILRLEGDRLRDGAGPSLPAAVRTAVDGMVIGPDVAACGSAAYRRTTVVIPDLLTDPRCSEFRQLAEDHGLAACWSAPILDTDGTCLGTFAIYDRVRGSPDRRAFQLIATATSLARIAITRTRSEEALRESRARLEDESRAAATLVHVAHELIPSLDAPAVAARLCRLTREALGCDGTEVLLHDPDTDTFVVRSATNPEFGTTIDLPPAAVAWLRRRAPGRPVLEIVPERVAHEPSLAAAMHAAGMARALCAELRRGEERVGLLIASYRHDVGPFTPLQRRILLGVAQLATLALENAHLVDALRHATAAKTEFVSTVSHELRTPLAIVLGYVEMLRDDDLAVAERRVAIDRMRAQILDLLDFIGATLDLSRLDAGRDQPRRERTVVDELLRDLAADYAALPRATDTALRWEADPALVVETDPRMLRTILKNLVGNALKFTPAGEIVVRAAPLDDARWTLAVEDTGVGISADQLPRIFEMFTQAEDTPPTPGSGGAGFGLYLVRRLARQLGGDVAVESTPGRGSRFTVTLDGRMREVAAAGG